MRLPLLQMGRFLRSRVGSFDAPAWGLAEQLFFLQIKKSKQERLPCVSNAMLCLFAKPRVKGRQPRGGRTTVAALLVTLNKDKGCHLCVFPSRASA